MRRFEGRWGKWDAAVRSGERPEAVLPRLSDESCIELLASGDPASRRYELNLLATELLNRLARLRRTLHDASEEAGRRVGEALAAADEAVEEALATEAAINDHLAVRQDLVGREAEHAEEAARRAERVREALRRTDEAKDRLVRVAEDLERRSRHH